MTSPASALLALFPELNAPASVNQTEAVKVIGSPKLLRDLEGEGLVVPVSYGKPKWYSVVSLQRAVLEKVRRNHANPPSHSSRGFIVIPRPILSCIEDLADGLRWRFHCPVSRIDYAKRFSSRSKCASYLAQLRWSRGWRCRHCGCDKFAVE